MQIVIIGSGNVGSTLADHLSKEGHNITVIDTSRDALESVVTKSDAFGIVGNGASLSVLMEAGIEEADLLIAVTGSDETNLLACMISKKVANCHTIVRVSDPIYSCEEKFIKSEFGLSMIVNPQKAAAKEMARILRFPSALKLESFPRSRMEMVEYRLEADNPLCGLSLSEMADRYQMPFVIPVVERREEIIIPDGNFVLQAEDQISIIANNSTLLSLFKKLGLPTAAVKNAMLVGCGLTGQYLLQELLEMGIRVKVIEENEAVCSRLSEDYSKVMVIHGNGTDKELLLESGLTNAEAFISLTNIDEENLMLALYAKSKSKAKLITKVHRISYDSIIEQLNVGSVLYPKFIVTEIILRYVRAMQRTEGLDIEQLYLLNDSRVEALEFVVDAHSPITNIPIQELPLKDDVIIASITHKGKASIPNGKSVIHDGDSIILITTKKGIYGIEDVLK